MTHDPLHVFLERRLVGRVHRLAGGRTAFEYDRQWLDDPKSFPISASLPLAAGVNSELPAQAFFANLLPEGEVRAAVARQIGLSVSNDYALLAAIGGECAGALTILPRGASADKTAPTSAADTADAAYERLDLNVLARMAKRSSVLAAMTGQRAPRLSLAGAQDKLPVRIDAKRQLWLPLGGAPSSHILKVPSRDFKHLPANEVMVSALARALSLSVVDVQLLAVEGIEMAVVRRYDRVTEDEGATIERRHQEDMCQALGILPGNKYEQEGGPCFADVLHLTRKLSRDPLADVQQLLRWLAFVLLAGNADGHGKNLSLLFGKNPRHVRLAPFYDLVSTRIYPRLDRLLAMSVGGQRDPGLVGRTHWEDLARRVGVSPRWVLQEVKRLATDMPTTFARVADKYVAAHGDTPVIQRLRQVIRKQCRRSLRLLDPSHT